MYADDPIIKDLVRRIEYLEKKVKDINVRTMPVQPIGPLGQREETPIEAKKRKEAGKVVPDTIGVGFMSGKIVVTPTETTPVVVGDDE